MTTTHNVDMSIPAIDYARPMSHMDPDLSDYDRWEADANSPERIRSSTLMWGVVLAGSALMVAAAPVLVWWWLA